MTTHSPSPISSIPPIMLEADLERMSDKKFPAKMATYAQAMEINRNDGIINNRNPLRSQAVCHTDP